MADPSKRVFIAYPHNPEEYFYIEPPDTIDQLELEQFRQEQQRHYQMQDQNIRAHRQLVYNFASFLTNNHVKVSYDQQMTDAGCSNMLKWFEDKIEESDYVILIATPSLMKFLKDVAPEEEVLFSGDFLYNLINLEGVTSKFLCVFLNRPKDRELLPMTLRAGNIYQISEPFNFVRRNDDLESLYALLTGQDRFQAPPPVSTGIVQLPKRGRIHGGHPSQSLGGRNSRGTFDRLSSIQAPLTDSQINSIASKANFNTRWKLLALKLGLTRAQIEACEVDSGGYGDGEKCFLMLKTWRDGGSFDTISVAHLVSVIYNDLRSTEMLEVIGVEVHVTIISIRSTCRLYGACLNMLVRVRLRFQSTPLHYAQKCWFTFDREKCRLVGDVAHLIGIQFGFSIGKHGIQLFMDDFLVPINENADVFRDNDLIEVKSVSTTNQVHESSSSSESSESSSPKAQSPIRKKAKINSKPGITKNKATLNSAVNALKDASRDPLGIESAAQGTTHVKQLRVSERKTTSGGVHLTFASSTSSSSSSETSSSDSEHEIPAKTSSTVTNPLNGNPSNGLPVSLPEPSATRGRGRGKGRGRRRRGRTLPSTLVIGGPSDIHSTVSTVLINTRSDHQAPVGKKYTAKSDSVTDKGTTGWDVRPNDEPPIISQPTKDYSECPNLEGAPRVGDQLAFKLLELSGSCTPEVSQYKLASVLAYDHAAKKLTVKYLGHSGTSIDNASSRLAQYALEQEAMMEQGCPEVEMDLDSLISPKLVSS